jgi:hypothetical protein
LDVIFRLIEARAQTKVSGPLNSGGQENHKLVGEIDVYVLEGSVRKAGGRVRITAQLIDALSGTHLWADRFDGSLEDVFDFQDRVASSVAGVIEPHPVGDALRHRGACRARRRRP